MSFRERRKYRIDELPRDLHEALDMLDKDDVIRDALGTHIYERFVEAKREEWQEYIGQVSEWELDMYLGQYCRRRAPLQMRRGETSRDGVAVRRPRRSAG